MKRSLIGLLAVGACGAAPFRGDVCSLPSTAVVAARKTEARTRNIVLVTIDGVRWQEIFQGAKVPCGKLSHLLPNLHALMESGAAIGAPGVGEPVLSSGPNFVSLPGYREIITGRATRACTNNECRRIEEPTLLDELRVAERLPPGKMAVIASWERVARAAALEMRGVTVSAGRHAGAGRARLRVSALASRILDEAADSRARPGHGDYRPDRYTATLAKEYLRERRPRFLWVALGDTDEYAHRDDYAGYLDALRSADRLIGEIWQQLGALGEYGAETTLLVTADHGRADGFVEHGGGAPESSRVWLVAAGGAIAASGRVAAARTIWLSDIAPTVRALLGLPPDLSPHAGAPIAELLWPAPRALVIADGR